MCYHREREEIGQAAELPVDHSTPHRNGVVEKNQLTPWVVMSNTSHLQLPMSPAMYSKADLSPMWKAFQGASDKVRYCTYPGKLKDFHSLEPAVALAWSDV